MTNPYAAGAAGRCPNCGKGRLFEGFLKVAPACEACGFNLETADTGDGPAVFVILIGGFLVAFGAVFTQVAWNPPPWLQLIIWLPLTVIVCGALLRPFTGLLIAAQFANKASQAGRDDV